MLDHQRSGMNRSLNRMVLNPGYASESLEELLKMLALQAYL